MRSVYRILFFTVAFTFFLVTSCVKFIQEIPDDKKVYFDFASVGDYSLTIDYKLSFNSPVIFYVYDEYPFQSIPGDTNRTVFKPGVLPILKGITEDSGKYSGIVNIKKSVGQLYIYSPTIGVVQLLKTVLANNQFTVDADNSSNFISVSSNVKSSDFSNQNVIIPGYSTLGTWNSSGVPSYLMSPSASFSSSFIDDINASLPEDSRVPVVNPDFVSNGVNAALHIIANAKVELVFIHEGAGYRNVVGYFHYPTNNPPTNVSQVNKIIAFPNASYSGSGGGLRSGNRVQLKYWNGATFSDIFPAGTSIGWFICANGYDSFFRSIDPYAPLYYSFEQFNPESSQSLKPHNVLLYDPERQLVVMGFEDLIRSGESDDDFNDAILYVAATPETAIQYTDLPFLIKTDDKDKDGIPDERDEFPNDSQLSYSTHYPALGKYHTIAFEDLWPSRGDYDMNDVVLSYNSTHFLSSKNQIVKITDRIKPLWSGGVLNVGFGYQMGISSSVVSSVTKSSTYSDNNFQYILSPNGTEKNQSKATIMVFDNIIDLHLSTNERPEYTIQTLFTTPQNLEQVKTPPYNPFIVVNVNGSRGREVHMPNYKPTDLADVRQLGTANDRSAPLLNRYYVSDNEMPFAILIPGNFDYPEESVSITTYYPRFLEWAKSLGVKYPDWYLYKQ